MAEEENKVGYRRPPVHTRFKPGQSGNPSGKRKAQPSLSQRLDRILAEKVNVTEGGKSKRMSREERAIAGDRQFGKLLLDYLQKRQESAPANAPNATDEFLMSELVSIFGQEQSE